jgi:acetolactate synthase-1/3 small subunit
MRRIFSVLMENAPGSLSRICGVFSQRGYNVDSLCVAPTSDDSLSRLTIITQADDKVA